MQTFGASCHRQLKCLVNVFRPLWTHTQNICGALRQQVSVCLAGKRTTCQTCDLWLCIFVFMQHYPSFLPSSLPPVDIREIRELRLGKGSRDFERYPEEARKLDSSHCFIVLYGLEFRLRTLSVAGQCVYTSSPQSCLLKVSPHPCFMSPISYLLI